MATKSNVQVHHMLRTISTSGMPTPEGAAPVGSVDFDVAQKLEEGYELRHTQYVGEMPGGLRILYIFVKNGVA